MPKIERIAILGANSQIALDYIESSLEDNKRELYLFARNPIALQNLVGSKFASSFKSLGYDQFGLDSYNLIINFIGGSDPAFIAKMGKDIFAVTDHYDDLAISYLKKNDQCKYIFISSGAAYGDVFCGAPASELTKSNFDFNNLAPADCYGAAKYLAEQRHRKLTELNIIDIRIFSYLSKRQSLNSKLFLSQLITAIKNKTEFLTSDEGMWRDYIGAEDFYQLTELLLSRNKLNSSLDCYSNGPIEKLEILSGLSKIFGLNYDITNKGIHNKTSKKYYFSKNKLAESYGYYPEYGSLELITKITSYFINRQ